MTELEILQQNYIVLKAKYISTKDALSGTLGRIADLKTEAVAKMIIGKTFLAQDLFEPSTTAYKEAGHLTLKAAYVDCHSYNDTCLTLMVGFLCNPESLMSNVLTREEGHILKELQKYYDSIRVGVNKSVGAQSEVEDLNWRLRPMKNQLQVLYSLFWRYDIEELTSENFLTDDLYAQVKLTGQ